MAFGKRAPSRNGPSVQTPGDKRRSLRVATFKNARIWLDDGSVIECIARDASADGCKITLTGAEHLPENLTVRLDPLLPKRRARIAWTKAGEVGLQFIESE